MNIPWGICITATVHPLIKSPGKSLLHEYLDRVWITGNVLSKHFVGLILVILDAISLNTKKNKELIKKNKKNN